MDALDGGFWQYGDDSIPEVGVTYFAGTFVRHPLALATTKASLEYLKEQGPQLRSEEHTSELQSLMRNSYAVFCLKKKKNNSHDNIIIQCEYKNYNTPISQ